VDVVTEYATARLYPCLVICRLATEHLRCANIQ